MLSVVLPRNLAAHRGGGSRAVLDTVMKLMCFVGKISGPLRSEDIWAYSVAYDGGDEKFSAVDLL